MFGRARYQTLHGVDRTRLPIPSFQSQKGLTSRAITARKTVNVGDVASDSSYLTALDSTRAEIIVPILDDTADHVIGTIDIESEHLNAFDSKAQALLEESANVLTKFWTSGGLPS